MEKKYYCYTCGAEVKLIPRIWSYAETTGKPQIVYDRYCPKKPRQWYYLFWETHPETESDAYIMWW